MSRMTLDLANSLIAAVLDRGNKLGLNPLSVAVLDPGGHLIGFQRQDGGSNLRPQIAVAKASGALALGVSSRAIAAERPTFVAALGPISSHGVIPAAGGVIITDTEGQVVGAVGVTGDTSDNDEACALAGIAAVGLTPQV